MLKNAGNILAHLHWPLLVWVLYFHYTQWDAYQLKVSALKKNEIKAEKKIEGLLRKKEQMRDFMADVEAAKDRIKGVTKQVERLQKQLPVEVSDTENLHIIQTIAKGLNIQNIALTPKPEKSHGFYFSRIYEFKARGTFLQFLVLLEGISKSTRVFNIRNLSFNVDKSKRKSRFQILNGVVAIEAYRQNQNYREDSGIAAIEKKYRDQAKNKGKGAKKKGKNRKSRKKKKNKKKKRRRK
jgi:Tfp pilus assembly protein PilO